MGIDEKIDEGIDEGMRRKGVRPPMQGSDGVGLDDPRALPWAGVGSHRWCLGMWIGESWCIGDIGSHRW